MGRKIKRVPAVPFVKWVGGKRSLLPELMKRVPTSMNTYFEPFVGGGALFFALASERRLRFKNSWLTDINERLIRTFRALATDSQKVIMQLMLHEGAHSKRYFEKQRKRDIDRCTDFGVAAWMIYLNRVCFNGLYRVNKSGAFNVPLGDYKKPVICNARALVRCAMTLQGTSIGVRSFEHVQTNAKPGDFVYFDPPYYPLSKTSNFTAYDSDGFGDANHVLLRDVALDLKERGVKVLVSNSSAPRVRELYADGFIIEEVQAARSINSKGGKRGKITDLLIT